MRQSTGWSRIAGSVALAYALGAGAPSAGAAEGDADSVLAGAKAHFQKGREAFDAHDYATAIHEFEAAEALKSSPLLLYNIGLAYELSGDHPHAVDAYRRYLAAKPDAKNRAEVEERISAIAAPPTPAPPTTPTPITPEQPGTVPPRPVSCPPGQLVTDETAGNCCWPGQVWSKRRRACAGVPQCPAGTYASGEICRLAAAPLPLDLDPWAAVPAPPPMMMMPPTPTAPPGTFAIGFGARREGFFYRVSVDHGGGASTCTVPCTLYLKPGAARIEVAGPATFAAKVKIPTRSASYVVQHRRLGSFIGGAILVALGTAAAITSTVLSYQGPTPTVDGVNYDNKVNYGVGIFVGSLSLVLLPIGISMMASLDENRIDLRATESYARRSGLRFAGLGATASSTGGAAALRFEY